MALRYLEMGINSMNNSVPAYLILLKGSNGDTIVVKDKIEYNDYQSYKDYNYHKIIEDCNIERTTIACILKRCNVRHDTKYCGIINSDIYSDMSNCESDNNRHYGISIYQSSIHKGFMTDCKIYNTQINHCILVDSTIGGCYTDRNSSQNILIDCDLFIHDLKYIDNPIFI